MLEWGEQRPWSPADLIGAPRELRSNGERGIGSRPNCSRAAGHFALPADLIGAPKELCSNGERGIGSRLNCSRAAGHADLPDERASPAD